MRKVGYLPDEIRMSGETAESKNQIITPAKKYGFITPYTSYLAADENIRQIAGGDPALARMMDLQMLPIGDVVNTPSMITSNGHGSGMGSGVGSGKGYGSGFGIGDRVGPSIGYGAGASAGEGSGYASGVGTSYIPDPAGGYLTTVPTPKEIVSASVGLRDMKEAEIVAPLITDATKRIGSKEFALKGEVWTDAAFNPDNKLEVVDLAFGSDAYIKAIAADKDLAAYAALGKNVIAVHNGKVYKIHL
jgi:hypothetical protein